VPRRSHVIARVLDEAVPIGVQASDPRQAVEDRNVLTLGTRGSDLFFFFFELLFPIGSGKIRYFPIGSSNRGMAWLDLEIDPDPGIAAPLCKRPPPSLFFLIPQSLDRIW
jgi:hypothetical protein